MIFMAIHLGFFLLLDGVPVQQAAVSQAVQIALANILALGVEMALLAGISVAYDQCLWRKFRLKPLKAVVIDKLLTLMTSPWNLFRLPLLRHAPLEWLLAWCCVLIPIAAVFPPGTLNVEFREGVLQTNARIPTLDLSDFGDGSQSEFWRRTLFTPLDRK